MKRILSILILCCVITQVHAYDFESNGLYYSIISAHDKTCGVVSCAGVDQKAPTGDVVVPSVVTYNNQTLRVIAIGADAFSRATLNSLSIPASVLCTSEYAFRGSKIKYLRIEDSQYALTH